MNSVWMSQLEEYLFNSFKSPRYDWKIYCNHIDVKITIIKENNFYTFIGWGSQKKMRDIIPKKFCLFVNGQEFKLDNATEMPTYEKFRFDNDIPPVPTQCNHNNKYKNVISSNLAFWYCPDCKTDLGDV